MASNSDLNSDLKRDSDNGNLKNETLCEEHSRGFGSDNHAPVHPELLNAIIESNLGHAHSYGYDHWTEELQQIIKDMFGHQAKAHFVFNGTAANILALKACTQSFQSVACSDISHIYNDECAGPEVYGSMKLIPLPSKNGKINIHELEKIHIRKGDQHFSQLAAVSITQPTEIGTCYQLDEIKKISEWAHSRNMYLHMDGARVSNAAQFLNCSFKEMTLALGVDVLSFGGTKNGFLMGEMVVFLNPQLGSQFKYQRKQFGQLPSKSRYFGSQFLTYFKNNLWKNISLHAHQMAKYLEQELRLNSLLEVLYPVESNAVFVKIPKDWIKPLRSKKFFYVWDEKEFICRLMMSWDTQKIDIDQFIKKLAELKSCL